MAEAVVPHAVGIGDDGLRLIIKRGNDEVVVDFGGLHLKFFQISPADARLAAKRLLEVADEIEGVPTKAPSPR